MLDNRRRRPLSKTCDTQFSMNTIPFRNVVTQTFTPSFLLLRSKTIVRLQRIGLRGDLGSKVVRQAFSRIQCL